MNRFLIFAAGLLLLLGPVLCCAIPTAADWAKDPAAAASGSLSNAQDTLAQADHPVNWWEVASKTGASLAGFALLVKQFAPLFGPKGLAVAAAIDVGTPIANAGFALLASQAAKQEDAHNQASANALQTIANHLTAAADDPATRNLVAAIEPHLSQAGAVALNASLQIAQGVPAILTAPALTAVPKA